MKIKVKLWVGQHPSLHYFETHHLLKEVGYKWVRKHARDIKRIRAQETEGVIYTLGTFATKEEAVAARKAAEDSYV